MDVLEQHISDCMVLVFSSGDVLVVHGVEVPSSSWLALHHLSVV
jgi:hypothetical protein